MADVDQHRAGVAAAVPPPDVAVELLRGKVAPAVLHKKGQQARLHGREAQFDVVLAQGARLDVEGERAALDAAGHRVAVFVACPAQVRLDPSEQNIVVEGLNG